MKKYVIRRLLLLIPILLGITFLSFALMRIAGSDAVLQQSEVSGVALSPEVIAARRAELGLDQPFLAQYFRWLGGFLTGDLGTSYISGSSVFATFVSKLPATLLLTLLSMGLTVVISLPLGILAAVRQNRFTDYLIRVCSFIGNSLPNFFVAPGADVSAGYLFSCFPGDLRGGQPPERGSAGPDPGHCHVRQIYAADPGGSAGGAGQRLRDRSPGQGSGFFCDPAEICSALLSVLHPHPDGPVPWEVCWAGQPSWSPFFMWDGVGKLAVDAINMRDYPVIQAYVVWMAVIYVAVNLTTDLCYRALDPRVRLGGEKA